jgi:hypothetical protein
MDFSGIAGNNLEVTFYVMVELDTDRNTGGPDCVVFCDEKKEVGRGRRLTWDVGSEESGAGSFAGPWLFTKGGNLSGIPHFIWVFLKILNI